MSRYNQQKIDKYFSRIIRQIKQHKLKLRYIEIFGEDLTYVNLKEK